jgi:hypothetical protein
MSVDMPFRTVDRYPSSLDAQAVLARLIDGLGFRFYWATEGLTEQDYGFSPGQGCMSIGELIGHIWGLANWVCLSTCGQEEGRPQEVAQQRTHALALFHKLRNYVAAVPTDELKEVTIDGWPVWHVINGPLADALTHVGQINSFRRLAGNPTPRGYSVFTLRSPKDEASAARTG